MKLHEDVIPMTAEFYNYKAELQPVTKEVAKDVYMSSGAGFYTSPELAKLDEEEEEETTTSGDVDNVVSLREEIRSGMDNNGKLGCK